MNYIVSLFLLVLLCLAGPLPYRVFHIATRNTTRLDGTLSKRRLRNEMRHLASLLGEFLLVVVMAASVTGFILLVVHEYVVPLPMVAEMLSQFDPDPVQWEYNIEHGKAGDMGAKYEAWSQSRGFSEASARFWQEFLWVQWLALAALGAMLAYFTGRFLIHFYGTALVTYARGVLNRSKVYERRDLKTIMARKKKSGRNEPDFLEARFVDSHIAPIRRDDN